MAKTPIEVMLDGLVWKAINGKIPDDDMPYTTHEGILTIGDFKFHVYQLNTGEAGY